MKTKVIHLLSHLKMGGAETLITDYALQIDKEKFEIVLVTAAGRNNTINEKKLEESNIKVLFLGDRVAFSNANNLFKRVINKVHRYILFAKTVHQEKPNIIHTHLATIGYIVPINTIKRNIKLFHTIHSEVKVTFNTFRKKSAAKYLNKRKGMKPIALHSKMQQEANEFFNVDTCLVVPNAIDMKRFIDIKTDRGKILESLAVNKDAFIIGHVGRFAEPKNHSFLIDVFDNVKQKHPSAHLLLIGTGNLEDQVKEQVKQLGLQDSVSFLGNRGDIPELMSVIDVFVFPSLFEGFGNVLIEAQAAGVKCVASDKIPSDAFVTNLVTPLSLNDSIELWAQTIVNNERPEEIEGNLQKHDIDNVIKDLENIYLE